MRTNKSYAAIGSGAAVALGSLYQTAGREPLNSQAGPARRSILRKHKGETMTIKYRFVPEEVHEG